MNQEIYNNLKSPGTVTLIKVHRFERCEPVSKSGWYKDSTGVTGRQTRRKERGGGKKIRMIQTNAYDVESLRNLCVTR
jgi:hypothetical protein